MGQADNTHAVLTETEQPRFNAETEAAIQEVRDIISGKNPAKTYDSIQALLDDLDSEE